jgi:hypothetical protein
MRIRLAPAWCLLVSLAVLAGCGERPDELGPYVQTLKGADAFNQRLVEYRGYLKANETDKAAGVAQTIEEYLAFMETFGETDDKSIMAGHNALKRDLSTSLKKIVEPNFPTFVISALKQIDIIEHGYTVHVDNLRKRWAEEERTGSLDLAWPEQP